MGKWVSEIRVPGTQDRLWLGSYSSPEAAAVAHDIAKYCLRENASLEDFNFPLVLPAGVQKVLSPRSVQKAATDAGMAVDAQFLSRRSFDSAAKLEQNLPNQGNNWQPSDYGCYSATGHAKECSSEGEALNISVDDYL